MSQISLIIPAFNASRFLMECLDSVKAQLFQDWECLVVNDGSTDDTAEIVNRYAESDSRFRLIDQPNEGAFMARLNGVRAALAPWVAFMDSDDTIGPKYLLQLNSMATSETDIVISDPNLCGIGIDELPIEVYRHRTVVGYPIRPSMWGKLYRRRLFDNFKPDIPKELRIGEDLIMNIRLAFAASQAIRIYPGFQYNYRNNDTSVSRTFVYTPQYFQLLSDYILYSIPELQRNEYLADILQMKICNLELFCGYKVRVPPLWWNSEFRQRITNDLGKHKKHIPWIHRQLLTYRNPHLRRPLILCRKIFNRFFTQSIADIFENASR